MKYLNIALLGLAVLAGGCDSDAGAETTAPRESTSVEATFDPILEPVAVVLPEEGAALDLEQLGLPPDIPPP